MCVAIVGLFIVGVRLTAATLTQPGPVPVPSLTPAPQDVRREGK